MKIKIIDLLNKIANGEEPPKKIMFGADIYNYVEELQDYKHEKLNDWIFEDYIISHILNIEVEILETTLNTKDMNINNMKILTDDKVINNIRSKYEKWKEPNKKIEKLNINYERLDDETLFNKINEIIDVLNNNK